MGRGNVKIGITERGDAGLDLSWHEKLDKVDGAVLITKIITDKFIKKAINAADEGHKLIVHCTCTGLGGTALEPNVPGYRAQLSQLRRLVDAGFPATHCVLRVDPVIPTPKGLRRVQEMLGWYTEKIEPHVKGIRYRMSVYDEYRHVKERLKAAGLEPAYERFYASPVQMRMAGQALGQYPYLFDTCAEDVLARKFPDTFRINGCISHEDIGILGLKGQELGENGQNRNGCHCLTCKTELLTCRHRCPNACLYCYWRD